MCFGGGLKGEQADDVTGLSDQPARPVTFARTLSVADPTKQSYHTSNLDQMQEMSSPAYGSAKEHASRRSADGEILRQYNSNHQTGNDYHHETTPYREPHGDGDWNGSRTDNPTPKKQGRVRMSDGKESKDEEMMDRNDKEDERKRFARFGRKLKQQLTDREIGELLARQQGVQAGRDAGTLR